MALRRRTRAPKPLSCSLLPCNDASSHGNSDGDDDDVLCQKCGAGDYPEELLLCDKCDGGYHLFCLRPILVSVPKGSWFCPSCSNHKKLKQFPLVQTKIIDFFRIQRSTDSVIKLSQEFPLVQTKIIDFFRIQRSTDSVIKLSQVGDNQKKRKRSSNLVMSKKKRKLLPFNPSEDPVRRLQQMQSLATALTASGTKFSNELTYGRGMAPRSSNCAALEKGGMQVLSKEDTETLNFCKTMMERGEWPPLMVVFDPREGFTVEADRFIKDLTIITEYTGDVDYLKNRENDDGDSMMTLLSAANAAESLVICPDRHGNIARFINGINNHTPDGKRKQNLKCVRFDVNGKARVLLIANRDIAKGERLYYDYNGLLLTALNLSPRTLGVLRVPPGVAVARLSLPFPSSIPIFPLATSNTNRQLGKPFLSLVATFHA